MDDGLKKEVNAQTINGMDVTSYLISHGANHSQMKSRVIPMIEQGMLDGEISTSATAQRKLQELEGRAKRLGDKFEAQERLYQSIESRYSEIEQMLNEAELVVAEKVISDRNIIDCVNAFKMMLEVTQDIFGPSKMTEPVICKAIEAASYGYWRNVMGPKFKQQDDEKKRVRL